MNRERKVGANYANQHVQGKMQIVAKNEQVKEKKPIMNAKDNSKVKIFKNFDDIPDFDDMVDEKGHSNMENHKFVKGDSIHDDPFSGKNLDNWNISNDNRKHNEISLTNNAHSNVDVYFSPKHSARSNTFSPQSQNQDATYSGSNKIKVGPPKLPIEIERSKNVPDKEMYKNEVSDRNVAMKWIDPEIRGNKIPNLSQFRVPLPDDIVNTPELFQRANAQRQYNQSVATMLDYGEEEQIPPSRTKSGQKGIRFDTNQTSDKKNVGHVYRKSTPLQQKVNNVNDNDDWSEFNEDEEMKDQYNKYDNYNSNYDDLENDNTAKYYNKTESRQQNVTSYTQNNKSIKPKYTTDSTHNPNIRNASNKEMPALPCEISISSGVASSMGPKEQLYFSKQPRDVDYKPYTLEQYKLIKPKEYVEISKMKPDLNSEELIAKRANAERIKEFSKNLRNFNSQMIGNQQKLPSGSESHEIDNAKKKILSARERALQFAKNIPKPKVNKDSFKSVDDVTDLHDDDGYMRVSYEQFGMESKQAKYLEDLEAKYMDSKRNVDAIKRQLK